jgi:hypothetical protein
MPRLVRVKNFPFRNTLSKKSTQWKRKFSKFAETFEIRKKYASHVYFFRQTEVSERFL